MRRLYLGYASDLRPGDLWKWSWDTPGTQWRVAPEDMPQGMIGPLVIAREEEVEHDPPLVP